MTTYMTNGEIVDVLEQGNEALVFLDDLLIRASIITVDILWMCREPREYDELHRYLIDSFGNPPDRGPHEATQKILDELVGHGLLKAES